MPSIPTLIPASVARWARAFVSGGPLAVGYRVVVTLILVVLAISIQTFFGFIGSAVAGAIVGVLIADEIRAVVGDLYSANFWRIKLAVVPLLVAVALLLSSVGLAAVPGGIGPASLSAATATGTVSAPGEPAKAGAAPGVAAADDVFSLGTDHPLARAEAIETYRTDGTVRANLTLLDMGIAVSDSSDAVGLPRLQNAETLNTYVQFEYREGIPRTVRIYLPNEYFEPRTTRGLEAVDDEATADVVPAQNHTYTSITVRFEGETTATFAFSKPRGYVREGKGWLRRIVDETTGIDVPTLGPNQPWKQPPPEAFRNDSTWRVPTSPPVTLQYDAAPGGDAQAWHTVPDCEGDDVTVCRFSRSGDDHVWVLARSTDPPDIRYKTGRNPMAGIEAAVNEVWDKRPWGPGPGGDADGDDGWLSLPSWLGGSDDGEPNAPSSEATDTATATPPATATATATPAASLVVVPAAAAATAVEPAPAGTAGPRGAGN